MDERPPHPRSNFLTPDHRIIVGSYPDSETIGPILAQGVTLFVNLVPGETTYLSSLDDNVKVLHFPIPSGGVPPSQTDIMKLINEILIHYYDGEHIYVHCVGGRGRAGTVASLLLGKIYGYDAYDAIEEAYRLANTREDTSRNFIPVPETNKQVRLIVSILGLEKGHPVPDRSDRKWLAQVRTERKNRGL
jgi:hypothetical protein